MPLARPLPDDFAAAVAAVQARGRFGIRLGLADTGAAPRPRQPGGGRPRRARRWHEREGERRRPVSACLAAAGHRAGDTPKPHLVTYRERLRIAGRLIDADAFTALVRDVLPAADRVARRHGPPTEFELMTALAFAWFAREAVDLAVVEVGLGGRLDATPPSQACVASSRPPSPTSTMARSTASRANQVKASAVISSNSVGGPWRRATRSAAGQDLARRAPRTTSGSIGRPPMRSRSRYVTRCGFGVSPARTPAAARQDETSATTLPFPFVPPTSAPRIPASGLPSSASSARVRPSPRRMPNRPRAWRAATASRTSAGAAAGGAGGPAWCPAPRQGHRDSSSS